MKSWLRSALAGLGAGLAQGLNTNHLLPVEFASDATAPIPGAINP